MPQYKVVARKGSESAEYEFDGENSMDATFEAMAYVLDRAMESRLWAKGRIELWHGDKVLHVMAEKVE